MYNISDLFMQLWLFSILVMTRVACSCRHFWTRCV